MVQQNHCPREYVSVLDLARNIRNYVAHNGNTIYAPEPSEGMIELLSKLADRIENPPTAYSICTKAAAVYHAKLESDLTEVMHAMQEHKYSFVPILDDSRIQGVFSEATFL